MDPRRVPGGGSSSQGPSSGVARAAPLLVAAAAGSLATLMVLHLRRSREDSINRRRPAPSPSRSTPEAARDPAMESRRTGAASAATDSGAAVPPRDASVSLDEHARHRPSSQASNDAAVHGASPSPPDASVSSAEHTHRPSTQASDGQSQRGHEDGPFFFSPAPRRPTHDACVGTEERHTNHTAGSSAAHSAVDEWATASDTPTLPAGALQCANATVGEQGDSNADSPTRSSASGGSSPRDQPHNRQPERQKRSETGKRTAAAPPVLPSPPVPTAMTDSSAKATAPATKSHSSVPRVPVLPTAHLPSPGVASSFSDDSARQGLSARSRERSESQQRALSARSAPQQRVTERGVVEDF